MVNQTCFERLISLGDVKIFCVIKPNYAHSGRPPWQSNQIPPVRNVFFVLTDEPPSFFPPGLPKAIQLSAHAGLKCPGDGNVHSCAVFWQTHERFFSDSLWPDSV